VARHFLIDTDTASDDAVALVMAILRGFDLPDPIAMAIALDPTVATRTQRCFVAIETISVLCRGQSVIDHLHVMGREPNAEVVIEASRERFLRILFDAVSRT